MNRFNLLGLDKVSVFRDDGLCDSTGLATINGIVILFTGEFSCKNRYEWAQARRGF
jgi:hypothetical protein